MMKVAKQEWLIAEQENKRIRDSLRQQFWTECGIKPARNTSEIDIPAAARVETFWAIFEKTQNGKEADAELRNITTLAGQQIAELLIGSFANGANSFAPDMDKIAPKILRAFFLGDSKTSYEWSAFDQGA